MDPSKSLSLTEKVVSKDVLDKNRKAFEYLDRYKKTISILERTNAALGKKVVYKSTSGLSTIGSINLNVIGKTH